MTTETDVDYIFRANAAEQQRLIQQADLMAPMTTRLLLDAGVTAGMRVLDVGSGAGDVAFLVARLVGPQGRVVGVDRDGSALHTARARARASGLDNVRFVDGDLTSAEVGTGFDAAVGRLVLLHVADPVQALQAIAGHVRPGGIVAFQELDMDPTVTTRSYPDGTLWDRAGRVVIDTFRRAGLHVRMGSRVFGDFLSAGLPAPELRQEAVVGGGPGFAGYQWLAGVARGLAPVMATLGVVDSELADLDTLADRLRDDATARGAVVWGPALVGAHTRRP